MQTYGAALATAPAAAPYASSAVFAPLAAPGASVAGAAAPDLAQMQYVAAAPGPSLQFQSLQPLESQPYTSFAATKKHKKIAGGEHPAYPKHTVKAFLSLCEGWPFHLGGCDITALTLQLHC